MVLVITDRIELSLIYATTLGGVMIGKQSIRRNNMEQFRELLLAKVKDEGALSTFFRGEQYVFVCMPLEAYTLNRMVDYQEEFRNLYKRPIPFFPTEFGYRESAADAVQHSNRIRKLYDGASSVVNAASDSISGMLAFLHFQKVFDVTKPISRVKPNEMSEAKILEAFNAREDYAAERDFADACLLFERLNWLVNCNVSNAIMQATAGRVPMAAGRLEAVYLKLIDQATSTKTGRSYALIKCASSGINLPCALHMEETPKVELPKRGAKCELSRNDTAPQTGKHLCNALSILVRCGMEFCIAPHAVVESLWNLFFNGYITWPSTSQATPWELKPALTASIPQLSAWPDFQGRITPADIEEYCGWDKADECMGRAGTIVTAKTPPALSSTDAIVYRVIGEGIVREFAETEEAISPVFRCGNTTMTTLYEVSNAVLLSGNWTVTDVYAPGQKPYMEYDLLRDIAPFFDGAFCEDFTHFLNPLDNLYAWGMVTQDNTGGLHITEKGNLLLKYISSTPLIDPEETLFWDVRMQRVAAGKVAGTTVFSDVEGYVNDLVEYVKVVVETMEATGGIPPCDCVCPKCGAPMIWDADRSGWGCSSVEPRCGFFIPGVFRGHTLTVRDMAMLLTCRESKLAFDFESKKVGKFPAKMVLTERNELALSFESKCICPKCKNTRLSEFQWGLACPDKRCGYSITTKMKGLRLTEEDEMALFSGMKTRWIKELISSSGKPYTARLYLGPDNKIKFEFPDRASAQR